MLVPGSGAGLRSGYGILFFIANILLSKLLTTFSVASRNNPTLFRKYLFPTGFTTLTILFNSLTY